MTTESDDDPLFEALRALRAEYLADAPARVAELWSAFDRMQNGDDRGASVLRTLVHRLAGSGGAYGIPDVTEQARIAEQLIDRISTSQAGASAAELDLLRTHLTGVADAFDRARSTE